MYIFYSSFPLLNVFRFNYLFIRYTSSAVDVLLSLYFATWALTIHVLLCIFVC